MAEEEVGGWLESGEVSENGEKRALDDISNIIIHGVGESHSRNFRSVNSMPYTAGHASR